MATTIKIKNSATPGSSPSSLQQGEFAINVTDGRLFYGSGSGDEVKEFTGTSVDTGSFVTTSSFNSFTSSYYTDSASFDSRINNINIDTSSLVTTSSFNTFTSSINTFTSSIQTSVNNLTSQTGSYATTGSNVFTDNQIITGSLSVLESITTQEQFFGGIGSFEYNKDISGAGSFSGNIIKTGASSTSAGRIYYMKTSGDWEGAVATSTLTSTSLLAISVGSNSTTDGMILNGLVVFAIDPGGNPGDALYIDINTFRITATAPTGSGNVVRKIGYKISGTVIYFNPSPDYIILS